MKEISHLKKREIQAPLMKRLLKGFSDYFGKEEVNIALQGIIEEDAAHDAKNLAQAFGGNSIKELALIVREVWAEDGAMEMDYIEETEDRLSFNVTRCKYAEAYEKHGARELGVCLSCNRDKPFTTAFNKDIVLIRTQTIMEGAPYCDFRFVKK